MYNFKNTYIKKIDRYLQFSKWWYFLRNSIQQWLSPQIDSACYSTFSRGQPNGV